MILPAALAVPLAATIVMGKASFSVPLLVGTIVLALAFLSPLAGLYTLVFSMLLGPEILIGGMGGGASLGRGVTLRFDDLLLVLVGLGWLGRLAVSEGISKLIRTPLNRPIMYYTAACVFATFMGIIFGRVSVFGGFFFLLKYYEYFFLYFMTVNIVTDRKQVRHLVMASLVTCLAVTIYALSQIPGGERVTAPFEGNGGEPNTLGGYLVFIMAVATGLLLTPGAVRRKLPLLGLLGLGAMALQATLSRTSYLAATVVVLGVLELVRRRSPGLLGVLLAGALLSPLVMPQSVTDRVMYTFTQSETEGQLQVGRVRVDTSTSDRIRSWQQAFVHFLHYPLWGTGITGGPFMDAMYPRVLMETGLLGFGAFLYLIWMIFRTGLSVFRTTSDPFVKGITLGFLIGFGGLVVHAIGANTFIIVRIMEPFWLYTALIVKSKHLSDQEATRSGETEQPSEGQDPRAGPENRAAIIRPTFFHGGGPRSLR